MSARSWVQWEFNNSNDFECKPNARAEAIVILWDYKQIIFKNKKKKNVALQFIYRLIADLVKDFFFYRCYFFAMT